MPFRPARCRSQITLPPTNGCIATLVGMRGLAVGRVVAPSLTPDRLCPVGEYGNKTLYFWLHEANKPHNKIKKHSGISALSACFCYWIFWRRGPESNRPTRICKPSETLAPLGTAGILWDHMGRVNTIRINKPAFFFAPSHPQKTRTRRAWALLLSLMCGEGRDSVKSTTLRRAC